MNETPQFSVIRHNHTQLEIHFSKALDNATLYWTRDRDIHTAEGFVE